LIPWAPALAFVTMLVGGCTGAGISSSGRSALVEDVQTHGLIVGLEGLQPFSGFRIKTLARKVGDELDLAHSVTSGNYKAHLRVIEEAHKHGQPIYLIGYSLGGDQARLLAEECDRRDIPIRILFLLDPEYMVSAHPGTIPGNVRQAIFYTSNTYHTTVGAIPREENLADPGRTSLSVEDFSEVGHMGLPERVTSWVRQEIAKDLGR
jgi:thioesterase domain-containing protein